MRALLLEAYPPERALDYGSLLYLSEVAASRPYARLAYAEKALVDFPTAWSDASAVRQLDGDAAVQIRARSIAAPLAGTPIGELLAALIAPRVTDVDRLAAIDSAGRSAP